MEGSAKVLSPSPEEAAFRKYYGDLLSDVRNPMKFAEYLLLEGVIGSDTKDCITSNEDERQKRVLLDSVQYALSQSSERKLTLQNASRAMENSGGNTYYFECIVQFVEGELY